MEANPVRAYDVHSGPNNQILRALPKAAARVSQVGIQRPDVHCRTLAPSPPPQRLGLAGRVVSEACIRGSSTRYDVILDDD